MEIYARLRELCRPIRDEELPELREPMLRAARGLASIMAVLGTITLLHEWLRGHVARAVALGSISLLLLLMGLVVWISHTRLGRRHHEWLMMVPALNISAVSTSFIFLSEPSGWIIAMFATSAPLVVAAFVPLRPIVSLWIACSTLGVAGALVLQGREALPLAATATLCAAIFGGFAAGANQVQRRIWKQLARARVQLAAAERMSGLGRMTAAVAHELKTPIAAARNGAACIRELARELDASAGHPDVGPEDLRELAAEAVAAADLVDGAMQRAGAFVQSIRAHTMQTNANAPARFVPHVQLATVLAMVAPRLHQTRLTAIVDIDPALAIFGDVGKFEQVLTNLVVNAVDACEEGSTGTTIRISARPDAEGTMFVVEDDGPGVPIELRERIFEPLFTTRARRNGTGLGLSISRDIAEGSFGGTLRLAAGRGARFELFVPHVAPLPMVPMARTPWAPHLVAHSSRRPPV